MKVSLLKNKELKNAGWIIACKVIQMLLSFVVSVLTARFLGPSNYGLIGYGTAFVAFFSSIANLGINSMIVQDCVNEPNDGGCVLGTALVLRVASSIFSALTIIGIVGIVDYNEPTTVIVVALCALALPFQIFDAFNYWFQAKYQSKVSSIAELIAYFFMSVYKIIILILEKDVKWFALATSLDYICIAVILFISYKKYNGPKLRFSKEKAKSLLKRGAPYILSGMMVAIYGQTDKLMLKQMLGESSVGYYSVATAISSMWVFILSAVIDSVKPTIFHLNEKDEEEFNKKNRLLYAIIFYLSLFVSLLFMIFGKLAIRVFYGEEYMPSVSVLKVVTWYTAFSYLGVARDSWIICKGKQKYLIFLYMIAAITNVIMNLFFIPLWGGSGAAWASLITQIFTSLILPFFIKALRPNAKLMLEAIFLRKLN